MAEGWDLDNLTGVQIEQLRNSPFLFMVFMSEVCGWWDGEDWYHHSVTPADEGYMVYTYVFMMIL